MALLTNKKKALSFCKKECPERECQGKFLKHATKIEKFAGFTIFKKGEYYCSK